ncbi:unnamed protein product [Notodromas monacha]|uniref:Uncharacterized protein n=1 Tax=Notodromas monacha TaxID=399045 RepID=A0A7R9BNA7_9CRUS|nr:unnamed protein product [Notodromas monacha]CAG0917280.1 unnamed protein product [Notodromas monacha]
MAYAIVVGSAVIRITCRLSAVVTGQAMMLHGIQCSFHFWISREEDTNGNSSHILQLYLSLGDMFHVCEESHLSSLLASRGKKKKKGIYNPSTWFMYFWLSEKILVTLPGFFLGVALLITKPCSDPSGRDSSECDLTYCEFSEKILVTLPGFFLGVALLITKPCSDPSGRDSSECDLTVCVCYMLALVNKFPYGINVEDTLLACFDGLSVLLFVLVPSGSVLEGSFQLPD